jgi:DNA-binding NtrC family response regulator
MIQAQVATLACQLPEIGDGEGGSTDVTLPWRTRPRSAKLSCPKGLVASSKEEVVQKLAKIMGQFGLATFLAFGVGESKRVLAREKVCLVLCDDRLIDGNYEDILSASEWSRAKAPVIVFSSTGDWPDYFRAIRAGAFDYMAYPPFLGELQRVICNALASRMVNRIDEPASKISNSS